MGLKKQWYKRSRKGDYSGLDTWKGWRRKYYQMQLYMDIIEGKRSRGRQRKTWMDNLREDLKEKNIDLTRIGEATRNREIL